MKISVRHHNHYRVCGLHISSTVVFPELGTRPKSSSESSPDVEFEIGGDLSAWGGGSIVMTWEAADGSPWLTCTKTNHGYRIHYPEVADFLIDHLGLQIRCVARPETAPETIRHLFLDQIVPLLLNLRGREALHASAIQTANGACAFIGPAGQGKSTLAAAFHVIGYPVLCDDCLLLNDVGLNEVTVEPAYPGLRLWDDSRGVLFGNARPTLPVSQYTSKRRISTPESNIDTARNVPLRCLYSLRRQDRATQGADVAIARLSMRDAFMELVEFAFRLDLTDHAMVLRQMQVLERVAREVPVKRLRLPDDLALLPAARAMILDDLKQE